jgi:hypothetical protein
MPLVNFAYNFQVLGNVMRYKVDSLHYYVPLSRVLCNILVTFIGYFASVNKTITNEEADKKINYVRTE